ncbi:SGNH/GDSL hydrolase family protein [Amycolatopsis sp. PS_44_ISF1]|uniref:SGNH/GDSL hydrolase family protein n=1 Tax=Amycolatopsis sp. PS_44_ISF1 TaxID=2974917 RepID=UPI0028E04283|nr:SGNH/GDSL hydrolase family protein [Amycolatopsis sp. PS_44_ISF1]MDT8909986.1 SGNH/GDSL hydrolase family protein [Amycolatopsis sp. PS_44_ISF1]
MRPSSLVRFLSVAAAAAALLTAGATAGSAAPLNYVNLGDSYSAGSGILPVAPGISLTCLQSARNWAHVIAETRGYHLRDVSCGGAATQDFTRSQSPVVPAQADALSPATGLVTMTIGGNDNNTFGSALLSCGAAAISTGGQGNPCQAAYGDSFADTVRTKTYPNLVSALTTVKEKAPNARIAIGDYLGILPDGPGCFPVLPIASGDVAYLRDLQATLDDAIERAADATGATFVDFSGIARGHDACRPVGTRWVEPVIPVGSLAPVHPNAEGERQMALHTLEVLGR